MMALREMFLKTKYLYHEKLKSFLVIDSNINTPISNISPMNSHGIEPWNRLQPTNITKGTTNWRLDRKWGSFSLAWHNASAWRMLHSLDRSWKACSVVCTCTWKGVINFFPNGVVNLWKQISCDFFHTLRYMYVVKLNCSTSYWWEKNPQCDNLYSVHSLLGTILHMHAMLGGKC